MLDKLFFLSKGGGGSGSSSGFFFLPSHSRYCFYNTELLQKTDRLKS